MSPVMEIADEALRRNGPVDVSDSVRELEARIQSAEAFEDACAKDHKAARARVAEAINDLRSFIRALYTNQLSLPLLGKELSDAPGESESKSSTGVADTETVTV